MDTYLRKGGPKGPGKDMDATINAVMAMDTDIEEETVTGKKNILDGVPGQTYIIKELDTSDEEMNGFLFRLGCYSGEPITLVSKKKKNCIVVIKDGRYNLDNLLAEAIII